MANDNEIKYFIMILELQKLSAPSKKAKWIPPLHLALPGMKFLRKMNVQAIIGRG